MSEEREQLKTEVEQLLGHFSSVDYPKVDTSKLSTEDLRLATYILKTAHTYVEAAIKEVKGIESSNNYDDYRDYVRYFRINKDIDHQGIGGKILRIDERDQRITDSLTNEQVLREENFATHNFIERRRDFDINFPYKLYYGHVDGLGYVLAEDEIKETI